MWEMDSYAIYEQQRFRWACTSMQSDLGILFSSTYMVNVQKFQTLYFILFSPKFCFLCTCWLKIHCEMTNSLDPDQTAPSGAVWFGSALFAYVILSDTLETEILGHLLYTGIHWFCKWTIKAQISLWKYAGCLIWTSFVSKEYKSPFCMMHVRCS